MGWFETARNVIAGAVALLLAGCATGHPAMQRAQWQADRVNVCVQNDREYSPRVRVKDVLSGELYGEIASRSFDTVCEWLLIPNQPLVNGILVGAGVPAMRAGEKARILPPGCIKMIPPRAGRQMVLIIGEDGLTPFAYSTYRW